jgi:hypothetical protein
MLPAPVSLETCFALFSPIHIQLNSGHHVIGLNSPRPSNFPNVRATPALGPHDAAILHGLTLRFHFGLRDARRRIAGTIQAQILVPGVVRGQ